MTVTALCEQVADLGFAHFQDLQHFISLANYADFQLPKAVAVFALSVRTSTGLANVCFGSAGCDTANGSTFIIPMKVSPKAMNPNTTAVNIVKFPVTKRRTATNAVAPQMNQNILTMTFFSLRCFSP